MCIVTVSHPEKYGGNISSWNLVYFPQYQQKFIDIYCLAHFWLLLFSCIRCFFELDTRKVILYLRNSSDNNSFFFSFIHFWGHLFGCPNVWTLSYAAWIRPRVRTKYINLVTLRYYYVACSASKTPKWFLATWQLVIIKSRKYLDDEPLGLTVGSPTLL